MWVERTHEAAGVTVVSRKLAQCEERSVRGRRPGRVPVTARLQLLPAQWRGSTTAAAARATKDRAATNFMVAVGIGYQGRRRWGRLFTFHRGEEVLGGERVAAARRRFHLIPPQLPGRLGLAVTSSNARPRNGWLRRWLRARGSGHRRNRAARMAIGEARNAHVHCWL